MSRGALLATPLGIDVCIRLPEAIPNSRLAVLDSPGVFERLRGFPIRLSLASLYPRSNIYRALITNPAAGICLDDKRIYARNLEVPSGGGVGTARAIARAYGSFANGGRELQLRPKTLQLLMAPAIPSERGFLMSASNARCISPWALLSPAQLRPLAIPVRLGTPGQALSVLPICKRASDMLMSPIAWARHCHSIRETWR